MSRLTLKSKKRNIIILRAENVVQVEDIIDGIAFVCTGEAVDKLAEIEDVMEQFGIENLRKLKTIIELRFKSNPRHLGREINGVYFTNEQCYILNQYNEFNTSYMNKFQKSHKENQELLEKINNLKEYVRKGAKYKTFNNVKFVLPEDILSKMRQLGLDETDV